VPGAARGRITKEFVVNQPKHLDKNSGQHLLVAGDVVSVKWVSEQPSYTLLEVSTPPGGGPPFLHRHAPAETFYVLEGQLEFTTLENGRPVFQTAKAGEMMHLPAMAWHTYKNTDIAPSRFLVVLSPAGYERFFQEIGVPLADPASPPPAGGPPTPEQMEHLIKIALKYMEILPPDAMQWAV
jgi:quercetin dioxygenase-like cupin family protein